MQITAINNAFFELESAESGTNKLKAKLLNLEANQGNEHSYKNSILYSHAFDKMIDLPGTDKFRKYW
jgi:hypothetical protein